MKKNYFLFILLLLAGNLIYSQRLLENFESTTAPALGWSMSYANSSPASGNIMTHSTTQSFSGSRSFRFSSYSFGSPYEQYLVSPELDVTSVDSLTFYYRKSNWSTEPFAVGVSSTTNALSSFTYGSTVTNASSSGWQKHVESIPVGTKYVSIRYSGNYTYYLYIDSLNGPDLYVPSCPDVLSMNFSNTSSDSTDLSFSYGSSPLSFELEYGVSGFSAGSGTTISSTSTSLTLAGLASNTTYDVYIKAICAVGDSSGITGPFSFTTLCGAISSFPYSENFDGSLIGGVWPCWSVVNVDGGVTWRQGNTYITPTHSTPYAAYGSGNSNDFLISPQFTIGANDIRIKFWDKVESSSYPNTYEILVSTTGKNSADFTDSITTITTTNTSWVEHTVALTGYTNQNIYVSFHQTSSASQYWGFGIDDFYAEVIPNCPEPNTATLGAHAITTNSANINWTEAGTSNSWRIEYGTAGFVQGTGTTSVVSNDTVALTGLNPFTTYEFYVTSICTPTDSSPWTGPYSFTTLCNDTNVGPWSDGVEGHPNTTTGSAIANCWTSTNTGSSFDWNITSGGTPSSGTGALSANTGTKFFYTEASGAGTSDTAILNTPSIDLSSLTTPFLEFYYHMFGNQMGSLSAQVFNGTTWTNEITITGSQQASQASSWNQQYVDLSSYSGVIKIRFIAISNGSWEGDISLDDIAVVESPACFSPTMAGVTVNTSTSATPSWSAPLFGTPTSYIVRYDTAGFNPLVTGTNVVSSTLSTTLTGLTAKTNYDYYVRTYCGGTDSSAWVGPISFYTWYCVPAPSSVDASGITNVTIGTINNTTGSEPGRYGDYDSLSTDIIQGAPAQAFSIQYSTGYTYGTKIWIDWNDNLVFDTNEQVYFGLSAFTNPTVLSGTFAVPASAPLGSHIMRIGGTDNNAGPSSPCYTGSYGSFEDYTVNVIPPCYVAATDSFVVCDSMMWRNGITYSSSNNTAIDTLKSSIAGICDTIFTLNLTVKYSTTYTDSYVVCDSMTWIDGNTYTVSNNSATHIIPNSVGCDSIITLDLIVNNSKTFTNIVTACESYTLPGGRTMNYTGSFTDTIPTTLGCDSVITTLLTINYNAYKTISVTSCGSYTSPSGKIWATSGTRYDTIPTSLGCDSLLTINLTVKANTAETRTISSCGSYTVPETGNTYPVSGTYTDFVTNAFGCIKTITTILTVNSVVASAPTVSGITLTSPNTGVSYKWMDCENAYSYILGETSQAYTPERNGEYAVEITSVDGCKDTSSCTEIRSVSLDEYVVNASDVNVYPNPSNDRVTIDITKLNENENVTIQLFDAIGKVIYSTVISAKNNSVELETSSLPQGIYSISISNEYFSISKKLTVIH